MLTEDINDVKITIETKTYGVYPNDTLVTPLLLLLVKAYIKVKEMETRMLEFDSVVHDFGTLSQYFSKLASVEVYVV